MINRFEYGQQLVAPMGQDVSTNTSLKFFIVPKRGRILEKTDGVAVGTEDIQVGDKEYLANEYLTYTTKLGDIIHEGLYEIKGEATLSATENVIGDFVRFPVAA